MQDEKAGLLALINELKFELKEKDKKIELLERQIKGYELLKGDSWIHAEAFSNAIRDAKEAEREYKKASREIALLKAKYQAEIMKLMEAF